MSLHVISTITSGKIIIANNALHKELPRKSVLFDTITNGYAVVMDYRTFLSTQSMGFPGRRNYVFVRDAGCLKKRHSGIIFVTNIGDVINLARNEKVFVVGQGSIYDDFLPFANIVHIMSVDIKIRGKEIPFPQIEDCTWELRSETSFSSDEETVHPFKLRTYVLRT